MRLQENVARMGEIRVAYKVFVGRGKDKRLPVRFGFQWAVAELDMKMIRTGFRVGSSS